MLKRAFAGWGNVLRSPLLWVVLLTLLAFAARLYRLAGPVLRWDEGWSLAHASLPWRDLQEIAAADRHPPAYLALLKLWLVAGQSAWSIRFLSVLAGTVAVPLAYQVARVWSADRRIAVAAAASVAFWPLLVYYGQVARMYALSAAAVLAAAYALLIDVQRPSWQSALALVATAALSLYSLYPAAWALAGLWAYAAIARPRRIPRLLALGLATLAVFIPWLLAARVTLAQRVAAGPAGSNPILATARMLQPTLAGLAFTYGARPYAAATLGIVVLAGAFAGPWSRAEIRKVLLPLLTVGISAVGVAYGARALWFAVRHLVPASAFLGLLLAWALGRLGRRGWPLLAVAVLALAVAYWPTCTGYVYEKMLEVTDAFDPAEDHRYLSQHAGQRDLVYFNVLARAGWYENLRGPGDPAWSYAMRWEPVIEPMERIQARIRRDATSHKRLWFALHKGSYGPNAPLVEWLDANLYPAGGDWQGEMLYQAYVAPGDLWRVDAPDDRFEQGIRLVGARWTLLQPGDDACALELTWAADAPLQTSYKVFVHVLDDAGQLVAQHDGVPGTGMRPTTAWQPGQEVRDRHGLFLPAPAASPQQLRVRVGLYSSDTGERLHLTTGADAVDLCTLNLH